MNYIYINKSLIRFFHRYSKLNLRSSSALYLKKLKISVAVHGSLPKAGSVLLISNHQSMSDLFFLSAAFSRNDTYFLGSMINQLLAGDWKRRLLPVFLSNHPVNHSHGRLRQWLWTHREGYISRQEAMARNRQTVSRAARLLAKGKQILIFPTGHKLYYEQHLWSKGVAHLLKESQESQTEKNRISVVYAHIERLPWLTQLRQYYPDALLRFLPEKSLSIRFSRPKVMSPKTITRLSPAELTAFLKQGFERELG